MAATFHAHFNDVTAPHVGYMTLYDEMDRQQKHGWVVKQGRTAVIKEGRT